MRFDTTENPGPSGGVDQPAVPMEDRAKAIAAREPAVHQALARLALAYPATLTLNELTAGRERDLPDRNGSEARLYDALFAMVLSGQASASVLPLWVGWAADARPSARRIARMAQHRGNPGSRACATQSYRCRRCYRCFCHTSMEPTATPRCGCGLRLRCRAARPRFQNCRPISRPRRTSVSLRLPNSM